MPAIQKVNDKIQFTAIGIASPEEWYGDVACISSEKIDEQQSREKNKARAFTDVYGGEIIVGYENLVTSSLVDAVYIPLPPALHYVWAKKALNSGKHVFVEKPSTTSLADTRDLISVASNRGLALHENYMFIYHEQIRAIDDVLQSGEIGDVRLYRISFGFPLRSMNDFRYSKALGGGALLDAGGYCLKYANYLLGGKAKVVTSQLSTIDGFEVEMFGSATMVNENGIIAQIAFGMDNDYKCDIEIWGSKGSVNSCRILTAPVGFVPHYTIKKNQETEVRDLPSDDAFEKSIRRFVDCVENELIRKDEYEILLEQESLLDEFGLVQYNGQKYEN